RRISSRAVRSGPLPATVSGSLRWLNSSPAGRLRADLGERILHLLRRQRLVDGGVELYDDVIRCRAHNLEPGPFLDDQVWKTLLHHGGVSLSTAIRFGAVTASARSLPAAIRSITGSVVMNMY